MLLFLIECKINTLTLKPKDVLKFNPIPLQLLSPQLAFIRIVKKFAWPLQPFATNRGNTCCPLSLPKKWKSE